MSCPACIVSYVHLSPLIPAVCSRSFLLSLRSPPSCLPLLCFVNKHIDNHNISQPFVGTSPRLSKRHGIGTFLLSSYPPILLSSYPPILLSSYPPILLSSYPPILLSSYPPILLSSCCCRFARFCSWKYPTVQCFVFKCFLLLLYIHEFEMEMHHLENSCLASLPQPMVAQVDTFQLPSLPSLPPISLYFSHSVLIWIAGSAGSCIKVTWSRSHW